MRKKITYRNVPMNILGQTRIVDEVTVTICPKTNAICISFDEWKRIEEAEHIKIMAARKRK